MRESDASESGWVRALLCALTWFLHCTAAFLASSIRNRVLVVAESRSHVESETISVCTFTVSRRSSAQQFDPTSPEWDLVSSDKKAGIQQNAWLQSTTNLQHRDKVHVIPEEHLVHELDQLVPELLLRLEPGGVEVQAKGRSAAKQVSLSHLSGFSSLSYSRIIK